MAGEETQQRVNCRNSSPKMFVEEWFVPANAIDRIPMAVLTDWSD